MRQLLYNMFITSNVDLFYFWSKKNLVKHQKASKYCDQDCQKNFLLHFMSLLAAPIFKNSYVWLKFILSFSENILDQTSKAFNTKFGPQWKDKKSSYQLKQILQLFLKITYSSFELKVLESPKLQNKWSLKGSWSS